MASNSKSSSSSGTNSHPEVKKELKNESPQPATTTRLTSFRLPRDLTLGGNVKLEKAKKVYTPNLNVQRKKKGESDTPVVKSEKEDGKRHQNSKDHVKSKKTNNLIQSEGFFSEASEFARKKLMRRVGSGSGSFNDRDAGSSLEKPKLNLTPTINKAEEDERLRLLLRDDFIDDNKEILLDNAPVGLPLNHPKNIYADDYSELFDKKNFKADVDVKPVIENGEVKKPSLKVSSQIKHEEKVPTVADVFGSNLSTNYIFMQLPTALPVLRSQEDKKQQNDTETKTTTTTKQTSESVLADVKEGCIGKIQILRSGKARLLLGDHKFNVEKGTSTSYRQDLVAIQLNEAEKTGDVINLGPVNESLIVSVDIESLLSET